MEERKENKMGTMPVNRLLVSMSVPIMISMLVQALYNIVDSIFVAKYSVNGLTAVSLAFPVQSLMIAFSVGTGAGINSLLSRRLGEGRHKEANSAATNGIFVCACSAVAFAIFGAIFSNLFFHAFTQNEEVIRMGTEYLFICTVFSFGAFIQIAAERVLQATGNTIYTMITQGTGAIINIILDPIFIFVLKFGVAGAAVATVIGQIVAMAFALYLNHKKNHYVSISFRKFRPEWTTIKDIYRVGIPAIVMQAITSVMTVGLNKILIVFSEAAVSVFGIYFKLQSFIFMPIFGLTNGMIPIVGYNFGAAKKKRIMDTTRLALIASACIMLLGTLMFQLLPVPLLKMFNADADMLAIGVPALRTISISFIFAGVAIVFSSVFQALGNGVLSLAMSLARQLVVILPVAFIFSIQFGLDAVWFAFPISELVSCGMSILMFRSLYNKRLKHLGRSTPSANISA